MEFVLSLAGLSYRGVYSEIRGAEFFSSECDSVGRHQDNQRKGEVKCVVLKDGRAGHGIDIAEREDHQEAQCEQDGGLL